MINIINQNEDLKQKLIDDLLKRVPGIEKTILDDLFKQLDAQDLSGGKFTSVLTADDLLKFEDIINKSLIKSGYNKSAEVFIQDLAKLSANSLLMLDGSGYSAQKLPLSKIEKKWRNQTKTSLIDSGIREDFKRPILQILDDAISYGDSIDAAKKKLTEFVASGQDKSGKLKSYLTQTARDSISQLQGQQMSSVAREVGVVGIRYVGGLLNDSRGQCYRWVTELNGFIPIEKLKDEIALAYKNQKAKKELPQGHKWGGMMDNTTPENFIIKRGGFNCTHTAIPVRKKP